MSEIKILIVDDSATKRALYKGMLEKEDYKIIEAKNGEEGLSKAKSESPDIIIADLAMPKMDGFSMIEAIKKNDKGKFIPVICVSATYKDIESRMKILIDAGAEEFFYMPENVNELLIKVHVMARIRKIYLELLEKNKQLQVFNKAAVDRELRMVELKDRIRSLEEEVKRYRK
ncbi:MAG: response regulator [Candidatus Omnitrophota bacterium]|nr:response regulator [Candidatus Omnitrophota bacterium]